MRLHVKTLSSLKLSGGEVNVDRAFGSYQCTDEGLKDEN